MFIPPKPPPGGAIPPPRAPTPPPPAAPPPSFQPGGPVASHPATRAGGGGRRFAVLGLLAVVVAAVVVAVLVLGGGDDAPKTLSTREIVDQNRAATVNINTRGPARNDNGDRVVQTGGGTGVVIDAERGLVVTNAHVVSGATSLNASVGGDQISARVRGQAPCEDLAVLQLRPVPGSLRSATLGQRPGHRMPATAVTALGLPRRARIQSHPAQAPGDGGNRLIRNHRRDHQRPRCRSTRLSSSTRLRSAQATPAARCSTTRARSSASTRSPRRARAGVRTKTRRSQSIGSARCSPT